MVSANVCYCITADQPLHLLWGGSVTVDFIFTIMLQSKENGHHFLSSIKITLILIFRIINLQIYRTTQHNPLTTDANPDEKRVPHCVKTHKRIWETYLLYKSCFYVLCLFYGWQCLSRSQPALLAVLFLNILKSTSRGIGIQSSCINVCMLIHARRRGPKMGIPSPKWT